MRFRARAGGWRGRARGRGHGRGVAALANDDFQSYDDLDQGNQLPVFSETVLLEFTLVDKEHHDQGY